MALQACCTGFHEEIYTDNAPASHLGNKFYDLLSVHALSGYDTSSYTFGKGSVPVVNLLLKFDIKLQVFADPEAQEVHWIKGDPHLKPPKSEHINRPVRMAMIIYMFKE